MKFFLLHGNKNINPGLPFFKMKILWIFFSRCQQKGKFQITNVGPTIFQNLSHHNHIIYRTLYGYVLLGINRKGSFKSQTCIQQHSKTYDITITLVIEFFFVHMFSQILTERAMSNHKYVSNNIPKLMTSQSFQLQNSCLICFFTSKSYYLVIFLHSEEFQYDV